MARTLKALTLAVLLALFGAATHAALAQRPAVAQRGGKPVRVTDLYADGTFIAGDPVSFRARLAPGTAFPVSFTWDFGDGGTGLGNHIMYRYLEPGTYQVTVKARNVHGDYEKSVRVVVRPSSARPVAEAPVGAARNPEAAIAAEAPAKQAAPLPAPKMEALGSTAPQPEAEARGSLSGLRQATPFLTSPKRGYTWVVATHLDRPAAEADLFRYWEEGFLAGIVTDESGRGSPAYRVVIGEFVTPDAALRGRALLPHAEGAWLLNLDGPAQH